MGRDGAEILATGLVAGFFVAVNMLPISPLFLPMAPLLRALAGLGTRAALRARGRGAARRAVDPRR